jgi:carbon monoxide dehydrogenase subunit G
MRPWQSPLRPVFPRGRHFVLAAVLLLAGNPGFAADSPIKSIDVQFDGEAYVVNAVFAAPVPPGTAWDVLTDFDNLQKWVPNVSESKAIRHDDNSVVVEQKGVAHYGAANFKYTTERKIELKRPTNIKTAQIKGNMRRVESTIAIEPDGKGTRIVYHLEIVPSLIAAAVMSTKFVEHEVSEQFTAIVGEMTRRSP